MNNKHKNQRGSAIIWILIAVGLFAALGYAFNSSTRTSTSIITDAEAGAYAKDIINFGNEVKSAVQRMKLRGCKDNQFNFANDIYKFVASPTTNAWSQASNANSPTDERCNIFSNKGGQLIAKQFTKGAIESTAPGGLFAGDSALVVAEVEEVGTTEPELGLMVLSISTSVCQKINELLNLRTTDPIPNELIDQWASFINANANYDAAKSLFGNDDPEVSGKKAFCFQASDAAEYGNYIVVLIPR